MPPPVKSTAGGFKVRLRRQLSAKVEPEQTHRTEPEFSKQPPSHPSSTKPRTASPSPSSSPPKPATPTSATPKLSQSLPPLLSQVNAHADVDVAAPSQAAAAAAAASHPLSRFSQPAPTTSSTTRGHSTASVVFSTARGVQLVDDDGSETAADKDEQLLLDADAKLEQEQQELAVAREATEEQREADRQEFITKLKDVQNARGNLMHPEGAIPRIAVAHCYIKDAMDNRYERGLGYMYFKSTFSQRIYLINNSPWWKNIVIVACILHCILSIWERQPEYTVAATISNNNGTAENIATTTTTITTAAAVSAAASAGGLSTATPDGVALLPLPAPMSEWTNASSNGTAVPVYYCQHTVLQYCYSTLSVECFFIAIYILDALMKIYYTGKKKYWKNHQHKVYLFTITAIAVDWVLFISGATTIRVARVLRPGVALVRSRMLRKTAFNFIVMMPELLSLFLWFFGCFVLWFAFVAVFLFADEMHEFVYESTGQPFEIPTAFDSIPQAFLRLIVLFSSENYPYLLLPAWASSTGSFTFFFSFTFIGTFFLRSIVLAYIVHIYMGVAKKQVAKERRKEWKGLVKAFNLLDHERKGFINYDMWSSIMSMLRPAANEEEVTFLFNLIDRESNGQVDCLDFLDLREVCQLSLKEVTASEEAEADGVEEDSVAMKAAKVCGRPGLALFLCVTNSVVGCVRWYGMSTRLEVGLLIAHVVLSAAMVVGAVAKLAVATKGVPAAPKLSESGFRLLHPTPTLVDGVDWVDAVLSVVSIVLYSWALSVGAAHKAAPAVLVAHLATGARPLLLFKSSLRTGLKLGRRLLPPMLFITLFLICVMYFFAILGEELFSGLPGDAGYFESFECGYGFSSFGCAMFTMYHQAVGNNWNEVMNDVMASDQAGPAAAAYFFFLYLFINLLLIDLLLAVTIEAFISALKSIARKKNETDDATVFMVPDAANQGSEGHENLSNSLTSNISSSSSTTSNRNNLSSNSNDDGHNLWGSSKGMPTRADQIMTSPQRSGSDRSNRSNRSIRASAVSIEDRLSDSFSNNSSSNTFRRTSSARRMASTHEDAEDDSFHGNGSDAGGSSSQSTPRPSRASEMPATNRASILWQSVAKKAYKVTRREGFDWRRDLIQKKDCAADSMDHADLGALLKAMPTDGATNLLELHKKKLELRSRTLSVYENTVAPEATFTSPIMRRYSSSMSSIHTSMSSLGRGGGNGGGDNGGGGLARHASLSSPDGSSSRRRRRSSMDPDEDLATIQEQPGTGQATEPAADRHNPMFRARPKTMRRRRSSTVFALMPEMPEEEEEARATPLFRFPSSASIFGVGSDSDDGSDGVDPDSDPETQLNDLDDVFVSTAEFSTAATAATTTLLQTTLANGAPAS